MYSSSYCIYKTRITIFNIKSDGIRFALSKFEKDIIIVIKDKKIFLNQFFLLIRVIYKLFLIN